jgi:hypothetical protein
LASILEMFGRISFSMQSAPSDFTLPRTNSRLRRSSRPAHRPASPQHHQIARLRHEGRHVADVAMHDDVDALHRDAAARRGIALDDQQPAAPVAPAYWLASPSMMTVPDIMFSATPGPAEPLMRIVACLFMPRSNSRWTRAR